MNQDVEAVRGAIANGADVNASQGDGMTGLHWAARHGDEAVAALLIEAGANVEATTRIGAHRPLHVASRLGRAGVVRQLVEAGADATARTTNGTEALHFAASAGSACR